MAEEAAEQTMAPSSDGRLRGSVRYDDIASHSAWRIRRELCAPGADW